MTKAEVELRMGKPMLKWMSNSPAVGGHSASWAGSRFIVTVMIDEEGRVTDSVLIDDRDFQEAE